VGLQSTSVFECFPAYRTVPDQVKTNKAIQPVPVLCCVTVGIFNFIFHDVQQIVMAVYLDPVTVHEVTVRVNRNVITLRDSSNNAVRRNVTSNDQGGSCGGVPREDPPVTTKSFAVNVRVCVVARCV
jgi:hypothetical protein